MSRKLPGTTEEMLTVDDYGRGWVVKSVERDATRQNSEKGKRGDKERKLVQ